MSACSELMCSQLLVPLAGLTSRGQAGLSCSLGKGGQGKLCVSALQWQGCRRERWGRFSVCPSSCCLTFSITHGTSWDCTRKIFLTKKVLFFFLSFDAVLPLCFPLLYHILHFFIPQTVRSSSWDAHYRVLRMAGQTGGVCVCVKSYTTK